MNKNIAITAAFNWDSETPISTDTFRLFNKIQDQTPEIKLLSLDWRTLNSKSEGKMYDPKTTEIFVKNVKENIDLVHIFYLGNVLGKWDQFNLFLDNLTNNNINTINPPKLIKYMINKNYLIDLQKELPIINTKKINSNITLDELKNICGNEYQIIKPLNGECGTLVNKIEDLNEDVWNKYKNLSDYVLIQPFMKEIYEGERAMVFIGDKFSHALKKQNTSNNYKINSTCGKILHTSINLSEKELKMGFDVKKYFNTAKNIRIDYLNTINGPVIMEIEAINPSHYYENLKIEQAQIDRMSEFYKEYFIKN